MATSQDHPEGWIFPPENEPNQNMRIEEVEETVQSRQGADQDVDPTRLPDLEPRLGYEPIDDQRRLAGQRATPVEELEKVSISET